MATKRKPKDWTKPKHLDRADWYSLAHIKKLCNDRQYHEAMEYATQSCDTEIRENIPLDLWLKMGGQLTTTGYERLKKLKAKA